MDYQINPKDFKPAFRVVGCFVESKGKILILKRIESSVHGNLWGIPSGKIKKDEKPIQAMKRELKEETNIEVSESSFRFLKSYSVRHNPKSDFIYYLFRIELPINSPITISQIEHEVFQWIKPNDEARNLSLVPGTELSIKEFYLNS